MRTGIAILTVVAVLVCFAAAEKLKGGIRDVEKMKKFLERFNEEAQNMWYDDTVAAFTYQTNLTDYNMKKMVRIQKNTNLYN